MAAAQSSYAYTVFARIIRRELPATFLHEDDQCIAIEDINPQAPVHFLVIPKKEIRTLSNTTEEDEQLLGHCMIVARKVAAEKGIDQSGYRVVINTGQYGCQSVYHVHFHVMGGRPMNLALGPCQGAIQDVQVLTISFLFMDIYNTYNSDLQIGQVGYVAGRLCLPWYMVFIREISTVHCALRCVIHRMSDNSPPIFRLGSG